MRGKYCGMGKYCNGENKCPQGCYFAECLQHARSNNADGFSFRGVDFTDPFCNICQIDQLNNLPETDDSTVYKKRGKNGQYLRIKKFTRRNRKVITLIFMIHFNPFNII